MGHKVAEWTHNISKATGPGTANKCTVQWWFKKFCKGDESLEDEESSGWPFKVDKDQLKESSKLVPLQLHEKLQKNSLSTILTSFSICSKLGRWKSSISGCLISWLKIQKTKTKTSFWGIIFYSMQQQWTITRSDCDMRESMHAKSLRSCLTLCDPMDHILPDSSVHVILQERILKWVAISSSRGSSQPRDWTSVSYVSSISRQSSLLLVMCQKSGFYSQRQPAQWLGKEAPTLFPKPVKWR